MNSKRYVTAILLAAGEGRRATNGVHAERPKPKQFLELAGEPMLLHPLRCLDSHPWIDSIVVVLPAERDRSIDQAIALPKVCSVIDGGETRQASLGAGLICIPDETAIVVVHDAARPLLQPLQLDSAIEALDGSCEGAMCAIRVDDALKEVSQESVLLRSLPRTGVWRAQTPQAFERGPLEEALVAADASGVLAEDCSELLLRSGFKVRVVEGDASNLKVTFANDLVLAESLLSARAERLSP